MDIDKIFKIYKKAYIETGSVENLSIVLYQKENDFGEELFTAELIIYNEYTSDVNGIESLFSIKSKKSSIFLDFLNIDITLIDHLLNDLENIIVYDDVSLRYFSDDFIEVAQELESHNLSLDSINNLSITNAACGVFEKLLTIHPYMFCFLDGYFRLKLFPDDELTVPNLSPYIKILKHIINLIDVCHDIIDFIFCDTSNYSGLENIDALTRYYIYTMYIMKPTYRFNNLPNRNFEFVFLAPLQRLSENASIQDVINAYQNIPLRYDAISYLDIMSGDNTCSEAIINLIQSGKRVQKCKLCNKYYFAKGKHKSYYCSNLYEDSGKTCQQIAAANNLKNKKKSSPILLEFDKAYKRNYARVSSRKTTKEDFRIWTEEAIHERDKVNAQYTAEPSEELVLNFKKYLGNK